GDPVTTIAEPSAAPVQQRPAGLRGAATDYLARLRGGDVGSLPAVAGLLALVAVFTILPPHTFTNAFHFANPLHHGAAVIVIAMGLVFVLLLGEIDLSAGFAAGTSGAVLGIALTRHHWPWWLSIVAGLATGAVIGTSLGLLVSRLGIPSFVVTLAAFLGLQAALLLATAHASPASPSPPH